MAFRRPGRIAAISLLAAGAMLALTGCLDVNGNVSINPDATASGDLSLALDKQAASFLEIGSLADFDKGFASGELTNGTDLINGGKCASSETDQAYVYSCSFTNETFKEEGGIWTITTLDDGTISFHMVNESGGMDSQGMLPDGASMGTLTVNATFPGPIQSMTGKGAEKTSDTTATIKGELTNPLDVTITSAPSSSSNIAVLIALVVAAAIIVLVIVVIVVLISRRKRPDAIETESAFAAPAPGAEEVVVAEEGPQTPDLGPPQA